MIEIILILPIVSLAIILHMSVLLTFINIIFLVVGFVRNLVPSWRTEWFTEIKGSLGVQNYLVLSAWSSVFCVSMYLFDGRLVNLFFAL